MLLLSIHIIIAIISTIIATLSFFWPSRIGLFTSYGFISLTLLSGIGLLIVSPESMVRTCIVGIMFLALTTSLTIISSRKLQRRSLSVM